MKPVFKCDYCEFMGTEDKVREHESTCIDNYNKKNCYTCQHRGAVSMVNNLVKYECDKGIDIPEGKIYQFCESYQRKEKSDNPFSDLITSLFGFK